MNTLHDIYFNIGQNTASFKTNLFFLIMHKVSKCIKIDYTNVLLYQVQHMLMITKCKLQYVVKISQNLYTRFDWHDCFRNPTPYAFCKNLKCSFYQRFQKLEGKGYTARNTLDFAANRIGKATERYWIYE